MTKTCGKCKKEKPVEQFYYRKEANCYRKECKDCTNKNQKKYRENNKEREKLRKQKYMSDPIVKEKRNKYKKEWRRNNPESDKKYRENNKEKMFEYHKQYREKNKELIAKKRKEYAQKPEVKKKRKEYVKNYQKKRRVNDPEYKLRSYLSSHFVREIKKDGAQKNEKMFEITGFKYSDYINHFSKDQLWEDYCNGGDLHIDHIIPVSAYDFNDHEEIRKCWQPENLRLFDSNKNRKKSFLIDYKLIKKYGIEHLLPERLKDEI